MGLLSDLAWIRYDARMHEEPLADYVLWIIVNEGPLDETEILDLDREWGEKNGSGPLLDPHALADSARPIGRLGLGWFDGRWHSTALGHKYLARAFQ